MAARCAPQLSFLCSTEYSAVGCETQSHAEGRRRHTCAKSMRAMAEIPQFQPNGNADSRSYQRLLNDISCAVRVKKAYTSTKESFSHS